MQLCIGISDIQNPPLSPRVLPLPSSRRHILVSAYSPYYLMTPEAEQKEVHISKYALKVDGIWYLKEVKVEFPEWKKAKEDNEKVIRDGKAPAT